MKGNKITITRKITIKGRRRKVKEEEREKEEDQLEKIFMNEHEINVKKNVRLFRRNVFLIILNFFSRCPFIKFMMFQAVTGH